MTLKIIVDTREQDPFTFDGQEVQIVSHKLDVGDYSVEGFEDRIVIERKSPGDLLGCMAGGRERFVRELERLQALEFSAVVCEGDFCELLSGRHSGMNPRSVAATLGAWAERFVQTHWFLMPSRAWAERWTYLLLERFARDVYEGKRPSREGTAA